MGKPIKILQVVDITTLHEVVFHESEKPLNELEPGRYAIVPYDEVCTAFTKIPKERVFHLGDLQGIKEPDIRALCIAKIWNSDQVRAVGVSGLKKIPQLSEEAVEKLVSSFSTLGIQIPDREGDLPDEGHKFDHVWRSYEAHALVWQYRQALIAAGDAKANSTFMQHAAGFDIVCGKCGSQYIAVPEKEAEALICKKCGNNIGTDLAVVVETRPRFMKK